MTRQSRHRRKIPRKVPRYHSKPVTISTSWLLGAASILALYFVLPRTLLGIPPSLIFSSLQDQQVRESLLAGDTWALRNRLKAIGVEDKANAYFESEISDDREREYYLDQQFRDVTGYYNGSEYEEGENGNLIIKK